jgi:gluconolactonase
VQGTVIAEGLVFPEGPVWTGDGLYCTEIGGGTIARWESSGSLTRFATTGGGPNGATLARDGSLWVTQNGGMTRASRAQPGLQRVDRAGKVTLVTAEIAGIALEGPNDLAFGPDGRLWFTDPRGEADAQRNLRPGRIFAWDVQRGEGELVAEVGPVFPNGIGFTADGTLVWTESFTRRVQARVGDRVETWIELPERHFPDGFCIDADGRLYVASTYAHCVSVIESGKIVDKLMCGDGMPTNCCFGGSDLYVTDSRRGLLWRFSVGVAGLPLHV